MTAGRPTDYKPEYCDLARKFCLLGATDAQLAVNLEVTETTLNNWKKEYPEFFESIKAGRETADANIADSLYHRALGYEHDSEEIKVLSVGNNQGSEIERVPIRKKYPPDPIAAMFWLKNRHPERWRDKPEEGENETIRIEIVDLTDPKQLTEEMPDA